MAIQLKLEKIEGMIISRGLDGLWGMRAIARESFQSSLKGKGGRYAADVTVYT